jgi:hypothetical protein
VTPNNWKEEYGDHDSKNSNPAFGGLCHDKGAYAQYNANSDSDALVRNSHDMKMILDLVSVVNSRKVILFRLMVGNVFIEFLMPKVRV